MGILRKLFRGSSNEPETLRITPLKPKPTGVAARPPQQGPSTSATAAPIENGESLKNCRHCGTATLAKEQFIRELAKEGVTVNPNNLDDYKASGRGFGSYESVMNNIRATYDNVQKRRAFICKSCQSTYCMECLLKYAPSSASGGKACPLCRSSFAEG
jgi:hypothetical protein